MRHLITNKRNGATKMNELRIQEQILKGINRIAAALEEQNRLTKMDIESREALLEEEVYVDGDFETEPVEVSNIRYPKLSVNEETFEQIVSSAKGKNLVVDGLPRGKVADSWNTEHLFFLKLVNGTVFEFKLEKIKRVGSMGIHENFMNYENVRNHLRVVKFMDTEVEAYPFNTNPEKLDVEYLARELEGISFRTEDASTSQELGIMAHNVKETNSKYNEIHLQIALESNITDTTDELTSKEISELLTQLGSTESKMYI